MIHCINLEEMSIVCNKGAIESDSSLIIKLNNVVYDCEEKKQQKAPSFFA